MIIGSPKRLAGILITAALLTTTSLLASCNNGNNTQQQPQVELPPAPTLNLAYKPIKVLSFNWTDVEGETSYKLLEDPYSLDLFVEIADLPADTQSYDVEVLLPLRTNARYKLEACNEAGCSSSDMVTVDSNQLKETFGYFKSSAPATGDQFGYSVALSADGRVMAVGSPYADTSKTDAGIVYVFADDGAGGWSQEWALVASTIVANAHFGYSVSLSGDGEILAVGIPGMGGDMGAVALYSRDGGKWNKIGFANVSNPEAGDLFGAAVALSADGNTLAVGAYGEDSDGSSQSDNSATNSGAVYVFVNDGSGIWTQQAYLKASDTTINSSDSFGDNFGRALDISADGNTLVVGAMYEDSNAVNVNGDESDNSARNSGAAYVFVRDDAGNWNQLAYLKASNTDEGDWFGSAVAISADGKVVAVGAFGEDSDGSSQSDNSTQRSGAVYVFSRESTGFSYSRYIKASTPAATNDFGRALALSADGRIMAVGAPFKGHSGAAYVFTYATLTGWEEKAVLDNADNADFSDLFGAAVALADSGKTLAVGAPGEDGNGTDPADDSVANSGAIFIY